MVDFIKNNYKSIIIILIIGLIFVYYLTKPSDNYVEVSPQDKMASEIEDLKFQKNQLEEKLSHANSQLEELQRNYEDDEALISLLQDQLLSYGIEPFEL